MCALQLFVSGFLDQNKPVCDAIHCLRNELDEQLMQTMHFISRFVQLSLHCFVACPKEFFG